MKTTWRIIRNPEPGDPTGGAPIIPDNWQQAVPEDIRNFGTFKDIKSVADLGKSWMAATQMASSRVALPGPDATDEDRANFYNKLGRPETADKYNVSSEWEAPEGFTLNEEFLNTAKTKMHELGLSEKQGNDLLTWYHETLGSDFKAQQEATQAERDGAQAKLQEIFGDKTQQTVDIARAALKKFASDEFVNYLDESGLGSHPDMVKFMHDLGSKVLDDESLIGAGSGNFDVMNETKAKLEIDKLKTNQEFMSALTTVTDPGHQAAVQRWRDLYRQAFPGTEPA